MRCVSALALCVVVWLYYTKMLYLVKLYPPKKVLASDKATPKSIAHKIPLT